MHALGVPPRQAFAVGEAPGAIGLTWLDEDPPDPDTPGPVPPSQACGPIPSVKDVTGVIKVNWCLRRGTR